MEEEARHHVALTRGMCLIVDEVECLSHMCTHTERTLNVHSYSALHVMVFISLTLHRKCTLKVVVFFPFFKLKCMPPFPHLPTQAHTQKIRFLFQVSAKAGSLPHLTFDPTARPGKEVFNHSFK